MKSERVIAVREVSLDFEVSCSAICSDEEELWENFHFNLYCF